MGFFLRWMFAFALVAATYNPTRWNFLGWAARNWQDELPLTVLIGLLLLIGYIIYIRAALRSIGGFGIFLVMSVFAALVWVLEDHGLLSLDNSAFNFWMAILALSLVLGVGLSWSMVRRMLTGQIDVDDTTN